MELKVMTKCMTKTLSRIKELQFLNTDETFIRILYSEILSNEGKIFKIEAKFKIQNDIYWLIFSPPPPEKKICKLIHKCPLHNCFDIDENQR